MYHGVAGRFWVEGPLNGLNWAVATSAVLWLVLDEGLRTRRPVEKIVFPGVSISKRIQDTKPTSSINSQELRLVAITAQCLLFHAANKPLIGLIEM